MNATRGFTLLETVIALALTGFLGLLAASAWPTAARIAEKLRTPPKAVLALATEMRAQAVLDRTAIGSSQLTSNHWHAQMPTNQTRLFKTNREAPERIKDNPATVTIARHGNRVELVRHNEDGTEEIIVIPGQSLRLRVWDKGQWHTEIAPPATPSLLEVQTDAARWLLVLPGHNS